MNKRPTDGFNGTVKSTLRICQLIITPIVEVFSSRKSSLALKSTTLTISHSWTGIRRLTPLNSLLKRSTDGFMPSFGRYLYLN
jgi:hypothetical protein